MIRHSHSLLISLLIHSILISLVFFLYTSYTPKKKILQEKRVLIQLTTILKEKALPKQPHKEIVASKKKVITLPIQKKTVKKKNIKKKSIKKKSIKKKAVTKKYIPKKKSSQKKIIVVKKKIAVTKTLVKKEVKQQTIIPKQIIQKTTPTKTETKEEKNAKLQQNYINENLLKIRTLIKNNLYYPRRARKKHIVGDVIVKFTLSKDATISSIVIIHSEHKILSKSAIRTIKNLSSSFPKPKEELTLQVPINYSLK
jgi:protein TonB